MWKFLGILFVIQLVVSVLGQWLDWSIWLSTGLGLILIIAIGWPYFKYQIEVMRKNDNRETEQARLIYKIIFVTAIGVIAILLAPVIFHFILK